MSDPEWVHQAGRGPPDVSATDPAYTPASFTHMTFPCPSPTIPGSWYGTHGLVAVLAAAGGAAALNTPTAVDTARSGTATSRTRRRIDLM